MHATKTENEDRCSIVVLCNLVIEKIAEVEEEEFDAYITFYLFIYIENKCLCDDNREYTHSKPQQATSSTNWAREVFVYCAEHE